MGMNEMSFPRYVYQQDAQPTDATDGAIWVDTNSSPITTYVYDGSAWNSLTTDVDWVANVVMQQGLNILINSVAASSTLNDWDEVFVDIFSKADGASDTIDTPNTTAVLVGTQYKNLTLDAPVTDAHSLSMTNSTSQTTKEGMRIETNLACTLQTITKDANVTSTTAYLLDASKAVLATAAFSGNAATFNYGLADATTYYLAVDSGGASYTRRTEGGHTYPVADTNFDWTGSLFDDGDSSVQVSCVVSAATAVAGTTPANAIVQTNAITIDANPTGHQVYSHYTLAGTGTITYDISFDNGSTWVTGQTLGQKNTSVHNGSQMILKLNLNGVGAGNTSDADDYGVLLY